MAESMLRIVLNILVTGLWLISVAGLEDSSEQLIPIPKRTPEENLMIGLIKEFANLQNVTQITACLPIPRAVGESIPWGMLTTTLPNGTNGNQGLHCEKKPKITWREKNSWKPVAKWTQNKEECKQKGEKEHSTWQWKPDALQRGGYCFFGEHFKKNVSQIVMEWDCRQNNQTSLETKAWDSVWSMTILSQFQYISNISWCFMWEGTVNEHSDRIGNNETTFREKENIVSWWNCKKIYNCSTIDKTIQDIPPLAAALKYGCWCRGLKNELNLTDPYRLDNQKVDCQASTIQSPGHLVWAMSDGTWTTHLSMDKKVRQITLGMPTLCPIWKKAPFKGALENLRLVRAKRSQVDEEKWNEPSVGVKIGWALESLLAPLSTYRNRAWLYKLTGQVEKLANVTRKGFKQLNLQLQATSKMTLQNRMALDMLLLKEHGVCGYLRDRIDHCCIHIPNVTQDVEHDLDLLGQISQETHDLKEKEESGWLGKLFEGLGIHLSSWVKSLISTLILLLLVILLILFIYWCIKRSVVRMMQTERKVMIALDRVRGPHSSEPNPEEVICKQPRSIMEVLK